MYMVIITWCCTYDAVLFCMCYFSTKSVPTQGMFKHTLKCGLDKSSLKSRKIYLNPLEGEG